MIFYCYLIWYGLGRFWIEGLRSDSLYLIKDFIRISQLIALLSFVVGVGLMIYGFIRYKRTGLGEAIPVPAAQEESVENTQNTETVKEGVQTNGTNYQRKRSSAKGKRKNKK